MRIAKFCEAVSENRQRNANGSYKALNETAKVRRHELQKLRTLRGSRKTVNFAEELNPGHKWVFGIIY